MGEAYQEKVSDDGLMKKTYQMAKRDSKTEKSPLKN
jgi:hypothetical protein